jgi:rhodanese-related sulfurtransferase
MLISFGRKDKRVKGLIAELSIPPMPGLSGKDYRQTRLIDLRSASAFGAGFVPGSYSIPSLECLIAARGSGLFEHRSVYLLADSLQQLEMCSESVCFGPTANLEGWFSPDALDEWQTLRSELGTIETITADTLTVRCAAWNTVAIEVRDNGEPVAEAPTDSLAFNLNELRSSLDGMPTETSICVVCRTAELGCFAASLLWNFGFHKTAYLRA